MKYEDLIDVAVDTGTDGIDMTVYWLPRARPISALRCASSPIKNRVEIYSIGTRVQLAQPTADLRKSSLPELRKWVDVAQRVGATHVRVFGGTEAGGRHAGSGGRIADRTLKRGAETPARAASFSGSRTTAASPTSPRRRSKSSGAPTPRRPG